MNRFSLKGLTLILSLFISSISVAQNSSVDHTDGETSKVCSGTTKYYDPGGPTNQYRNIIAQTTQHVFTSPAQGSKLQIQFNNVDLYTQDSLAFYNGSGAGVVAYANMIGYIKGNQTFDRDGNAHGPTYFSNPGEQTVTFELYVDDPSNLGDDGWDATITTNPSNCQNGDPELGFTGANIPQKINNQWMLCPGVFYDLLGGINNLNKDGWYTNYMDVDSIIFDVQGQIPVVYKASDGNVTNEPVGSGKGRARSTHNVSFATGGEYDITVSIYDEFCCVYTITETVVVLSAPTVAFTPAGSPGYDVCQGNNLEIFANPSVTPSGAYTPSIQSARWIPEAGANIAGANLEHKSSNAPGPHDYEFEIIYTEDANCIFTQQIDVSVNVPPFAGTEKDFDVAAGPAVDSKVLCSGDANPYILLNSTNGDYTSGAGTWSGPAPISGGNKIDGNSAFIALGAGEYAFTYTVGDVPGCPDDQLEVSVVIEKTPFAGQSMVSFEEFCSNNQNIDLFDLLDPNGTTPPDRGGTWTARSGSSQAPLSNDANAPNAIFSGAGGVDYLDAAALTIPFGSGSYFFEFTYRVESSSFQSGNSLGHGNCGFHESKVKVEIVRNPNAGRDTTINVCSSEFNIELDDLLNGNNYPANDGTWSVDPSTPSTGFASPDNYIPANETNNGNYKINWRIGGANIEPTCAADQMTVNINFIHEPDAGESKTVDVELCDVDNSYILFHGLFRNPERRDGFWYGPNSKTKLLNLADPKDSIVDISLMAGQTNTYYYRVDGNEDLFGNGCPDDESSVTIKVTEGKVAGTENIGFFVCAGDESFRLFDKLKGNPDEGGTWRRIKPFDPNTYSWTKEINPVSPTSPENQIWCYTFEANGGCPESQACLDFIISPKPVAGLANEVDPKCDADGIISLGDLFVNGGNGYPGTTPGTTWKFKSRSGAQVINASAEGSVNLFPLGGLTYFFDYVVSASGCPSDSIPLLLTVNAKGNAGPDVAYATCSSDNPFDIFVPISNSGSTDKTGNWVDVDETDALFGVGNNPLFLPETFTGEQPACYEFQYIVEEDNCPNDTSFTTLCVSVQQRGGITAQTLPVCENGIVDQDLFEGLQAGSYDGGGRWTLDVYPPGRALDAQFMALRDHINNGANRNDYFTPPAPGSENLFNFDRFVNDYVNTHGGDPETIFNNPEFRFTYIVRDNTAGDFQGEGVSGLEYLCPSDTGFTYVIINRDWSNPSAGFTLDPQTGNSILNPPVSENGEVVVCETTSDFDLKEYFTGLEAVYSRVNEDVDDFKFTGINPKSAIYNVVQGGIPNNHLLDVSQLEPGDEYDIVISVANNCINPLFSTGPLKVVVEGLPDAGSDRQLDLCSTGETKWLADVEVLELPYSADHDDTQHRFDPTPGVGSALAGEFFNPKKVDLTGTDKAFLRVNYVRPGQHCPTSVAPINITVSKAPSPGPDQRIEVCGGEIIQLRNFYNDPSISKDGVFKCPSCDPAYLPQPFASATFDTKGQDGNIITFFYVLEGAGIGCAPDSSVLELVVKDEPFAGHDNVYTVCENEDAFFMLEHLKDTSTGAFPTTPGTFNPDQAKGKNGNFFNPKKAGAGTYNFEYIVGDGDVCDYRSANLSIVVEKTPAAGSNGTEVACVTPTSPLVNLFNVLNGNPDFNGTFDAFNPEDDIFLSGTNNKLFDHKSYSQKDGATDTILFKYTVSGVACNADEAVATVVLKSLPLAGRNLDTIVAQCESTASYNLFDALGVKKETETGAGDYHPGGTWTAIGVENGNLIGSGISPNTLTPGREHPFRYTVSNVCGSAEAIVNIAIDELPTQFEDGSADACRGEEILELSTIFPRYFGGEWREVNSTNGIIDGNRFDPDAADPKNLPEYVLEYAVPSALGACPEAIADITLNVFAKPNAGGGKDKRAGEIVCYEAAEDINLLELLDVAEKKDFPGSDLISQDGEFTVPDEISGFFGNAILRVTNMPEPSTDKAFEIVYEVERPTCGKDESTVVIQIISPSSTNHLKCGDYDGDGISNAIDVDDDNDGIRDLLESGGLELLGDDDHDLTLNFEDVDYISEQNAEKINGVISTYDADGDGIINMLDLDSDNDKIWDLIENHPTNYQNIAGYEVGKSPASSVNTIGINPTADDGKLIDTDDDGLFEYDFIDLDSDNDGIMDKAEAAPDYSNPVNTTVVLDPLSQNKIADYRTNDADGDMITDNIENDEGDGFDGAGGIRFTDTDGDGIPDFRDIDSDNDDVADNIESRDDFDGDNIPNFRDSDSDNDWIADGIEYYATPAKVVGPQDTDEDGMPDFLDTDSDDDGISDKLESGNKMVELRADDSDNDGDYDFREIDSDDDKILDWLEAVNVLDPRDSDEDGKFDFKEKDADNDGYPDMFEANNAPDSSGYIMNPFDKDGDELYDYQDTDSDNDGIPDAIELADNNGIIPSNLEGTSLAPFDNNKDGIPDFWDEDSDSDRILDADEAGFDPEQPDDSDQDGIYDFRDLDSDGDGIADIVEGNKDCDGDLVPNYKDFGDNCKTTTFVPEGFSPNGDDVNDFFTIPEIKDGLFPNNKLSVLNRWGNVVYEKTNYDNTWNGVTDDGNELPDGTYFYVLDLGLGQDPLTGYVYIARGGSK